MTENEKLKDALAVFTEDGMCMEDFLCKYGEYYDDVIEQAARKWAEVEPLLEEVYSTLGDVECTLSMVTDDCGAPFMRDCQITSASCKAAQDKIAKITAREAGNE